QVRIPSQDAGSFTSRVLPGAPTATPLPPVADARKPEPKPETKPDELPEPAVAPKPEPAPKVEPPKPEPKPDSKSAETLRAEKILAGGDAPRAEPPKSDSGQWVLQLGAYAEQGNVKVLQGKIKELGYPSYTEKVTTPQGERIRVRAGPFSSKIGRASCRERGSRASVR